MLLQSVVIAGILSAACFLSVVLWAGFGAAIAHYLRHPLARQGLNWSMAGLLLIPLISVFG
jgi:threonine/homoserine/homoserine lactone efflux protein